VSLSLLPHSQHVNAGSIFFFITITFNHHLVNHNNEPNANQKSYQILYHHQIELSKHKLTIAANTAPIIKPVTLIIIFIFYLHCKFEQLTGVDPHHHS